MSVTFAKGFKASGLACGLKSNGNLDLALVVTNDAASVPAAAVFTKNRVSAAPVNLSRANLTASKGFSAGVILNSGCANAATGRTGEDAARKTLACLAEELNIDTTSLLVCSTGLIGMQLEYEKIESKIAELVTTSGSDYGHGLLAATAIMTTDTHPKQSQIEMDGIRVGAMAKGAGMINPNMATMLAVITTDADVSPDVLQEVLSKSVGKTFNSLSIDGCTSTNDTVCLLASGKSGKVSPDVLEQALDFVCMDLATQIAKDAEGATKFVRYKVVGAKDDASAQIAARQIGESLLVKTSIYGEDVYPGRVLSELGASLIDFDLDLVRVFYGDICIFADSMPKDIDALTKDKLTAYMAGDEIEITCDLGMGTGKGMLLGTDLGHGYIDENMKTS